MSQAWEYYVITLLVYFGTNAIACWSLNLQYGVAGIMKFRLHPVPSGRRLHGRRAHARPGDSGRIPGLCRRHDAPLAGAAPRRCGGGCALALVVGIVALRPQRRDYQAVLMLIISIIATTLISTETSS